MIEAVMLTMWMRLTRQVTGRVDALLVVLLEVLWIREKVP
jgi:hypothetical protein